MKNILSDAGIQQVVHYAPLHYLAHIARSRRLYSKQRLREIGFSDSHLRSTSSRQDVRRGFARYVHLSTETHPPILKAKLGAGFPHFEVSLPSVEVETTPYLLCRFNIAKTRYFRGARTEPLECDANGRYYEQMLLPVAKTTEEKINLLEHNSARMVEVLVQDELVLTETCTFRFFREEDKEMADQALTTLGAKFTTIVDANMPYKSRQLYMEKVAQALDRSVNNADWKGDGLEFDRV